MKISDFYNTEFCQFALYDNFRSISSYIDFKPSARKVIYTVRKLNITSHERVCDIASDTSKQTKYKHGNVSLEGVIVGMAQDFPCANNINLLYPDGSFGTRTIPVPAASRYIHSCKTKILDKIIRKEDDAILIQQESEGYPIEPKFFIPVIPMVIINGSEGIGNGYSQKILPRNPTEVIQWIYNRLNNKPTSMLVPYYEGFKGTFVSCGDNKWECWGKVEKGNYCSVIVTEVPIGYTSKSWVEKLDSLEEKKIIKSYVDESNDNTFHTTIKVDRTFLDLSEQEQHIKLGLVKSFTENFTCLDENNMIREFETIEDVLDSFISIRLEYYNKRIEYQLGELKENLKFLEQKYNFIMAVINNKIHISKNTKKQLEECLINLTYETKNGTFDYLLNMPIYSMTSDKLDALKKEIELVKEEIEVLMTTTHTKLWVKELKEIAKEM